MIKSSSIEYIKNFYTILFQLINFLIDKYPEDNKARLYKRKVESARRINTRFVIAEFMKNMISHETYIINKDHNYFINLNYNNNVDKENLQEVFRLRKLWIDSNDEESKEFVFKCLQELLYYGHLLGY